MPPKRQQPVKVYEKLPAVGSGSVGIVTEPAPKPEKCGNIAAALRSTESLPEACRLMLVAGLDWSLGVDPSKRDSSQERIVSFIGEVLARRRAELATRTECFEADVSCAQSVADEHAEVVREAEADVEREANIVSAKRAIFEEDDSQVRQARELTEAAERARSACEADLLAMDLDRDLCQLGQTLVNDGAASTEINTTKLTESIGHIQSLAARLGLEQSLVNVLQFLAKKPMDEWSVLEKGGAQMIDATLSKHLVDLDGKLESGPALRQEHAAALETEKAKLEAVKERCAASAASLKEAESRHSEVEKTAKDAKQVAKQSADELEKAQRELSASQNELTAYSEGPMETFLTLNGAAAVEREVAAREAAAKCKAELLESKEELLLAEPCSKKPRLADDTVADDMSTDATAGLS